jgi:alkylation response protein AidB-like acyl-CoA dehydrogenase
MDQRCFMTTVRRSAEEAKAGQGPGPASSMFKLYGTEMNKRRYELLVKILGTNAFGWEGDGFTPRELATTREWLRSKGNSIEGGTSEVQLNIIAKRVLGLPDYSLAGIPNMPLLALSSEEQELLRNTAREFIAEHSPVKELRRLRDSNDPVGFSRDLWKQMASSARPASSCRRARRRGSRLRGLGLSSRSAARARGDAARLDGAARRDALLLAGNGTQRRTCSAQSPGRDVSRSRCRKAHHAPYRVATRAERPWTAGSSPGRDVRADGHVADPLIVVARTAGPASATAWACSS